MKKVKYIFKGFLSCLIAAIISISSSNLVFAESILDDIEIEWEDMESEDIAGDYAEDTEYSRTRGNHLNYGNSTITKLGINKIGVSGMTMAHHTCDKLRLYLYIERKTSSNYGTYKDLSSSVSNDYSLYRSYTVLVPSGYYYRIRGYHSAYDDGTNESVQTLTNGIYIG